MARAAPDVQVLARTLAGHGAKCYRRDRQTSVWFGTQWLPLCDIHHQELMEVRETYCKTDVLLRSTPVEIGYPERS